MDETPLLVVPVKTEVGFQLLQTRCVVAQFAMDRSRRSINFDGSSANILLFSSQKTLLFLMQLAQNFV